VRLYRLTNLTTLELLGNPVNPAGAIDAMHAGAIDAMRRRPAR